MRKPIFALLLIAAAASQLGATDCGGDPPIIVDPGFDLWCGDQLCAWHVDRGEIKKAATWHSEDAGVELLSADTAISQLSQTHAQCIEFSFIANVDPTVDLRLEADVFNDGNVEYSEHIPTARWQPLTYRMRFARNPDGARFRFIKRGEGAAVLAQLEARSVTNCSGRPAIELKAAPNGYQCAQNAECRSNFCNSGGSDRGVCADCGPGLVDSCPIDKVCATVDPQDPNQSESFACSNPGERELGERCSSDAECESQICNVGRCAACGPANACDNDQICGPSVPVKGPFVCAPGKFAGAMGAACFTNADCASATCNGAVMRQCPDGRTCGTTADCPSEGSEQHGPCVPVGVQGGTCS
ncbi:MAG TPA: hypothetical protein PLF40_11035 [Kofleriaceae bacterium]|nr:hypothetical protein [Kofleriaceae bacterium]